MVSFPIRLQDSLIINIPGKKQSVSKPFCIEIKNNRDLIASKSTAVGCVTRCAQSRPDLPKLIRGIVRRGFKPPPHPPPPFLKIPEPPSPPTFKVKFSSDLK